MIEGRDSLKQVPANTPFKPAAQIKRELGLTELLRMGANENPLGASPRAAAAIARAAAESQYYPDAGNLELRARLSEKLGFPMEQIVVEAGISGLLRVALEAFVEPGQRVAFPWPTFAVYPLMTLSLGGTPVPVPLRPDMGVDFPALTRAADGARMVWICNPNNPTGRGEPLAEIRALASALDPGAALVVDEAYIEFADQESALPLVREGLPVVVMRTFSKAYGLAGLRVGYAVMAAEIADWFNRCREPFQVTGLGQAAALAALDDEGFLARSIATIREGREYLFQECRRLGIDPILSEANFILLTLGGDCRPLSRELLKQGIMVRATDDIFDLPGHLRVTVGTPEMNRKFIAALPGALRATGLA